MDRVTAHLAQKGDNYPKGIITPTRCTAISNIASSLRSNYEQPNEEQVVLDGMDGEEGGWENQEDLFNSLREVSVI